MKLWTNLETLVIAKKVNLRILVIILLDSQKALKAIILSLISQENRFLRS